MKNVPKSRRILLCIGCNDYQSLDRLSTAEKDAQDMYALLTNADYGAYDLDASELLLSPDLALVDQTLDKLLQNISSADIVTLFFAGHGGVS